MPELKKRLYALDLAEPPDLWPSAEQRAPGSLPPVDAAPTRLAKRLSAGIVASAIFFVGFAWVWTALRENSPITNPQGPAANPSQSSPGPSGTPLAVTVPDMTLTATNTDGGPSLVEQLGGSESVLTASKYGAWRDGQLVTVLQKTDLPTYPVPTGTRVVFSGDANTVAWGWGPGSDHPYDAPVPLSEGIPVIVMGSDGESVLLRLRFEWADGTYGEWSLQFTVRVPPRDQLQLACPTQDHEGFNHSGGSLLPGADLFIRANVQGIGPRDAVVQVTWPDGQGSWSGTWAVYREGALVAFVQYEGLSGVACKETGIGGVRRDVGWIGS
jgi:hypothetical protein